MAPVTAQLSEFMTAAAVGNMVLPGVPDKFVIMPSMDDVWWNAAAAAVAEPDGPALPS